MDSILEDIGEKYSRINLLYSSTQSANQKTVKNLNDSLESEITASRNALEDAQGEEERRVHSTFESDRIFTSGQNQTEYKNLESQLRTKREESTRLTKLEQDIEKAHLDQIKQLDKDMSDYETMKKNEIRDENLAFDLRKQEIEEKNVRDTAARIKLKQEEEERAKEQEKLRLASVTSKKEVLTTPLSTEATTISNVRIYLIILFVAMFIIISILMFKKFREPKNLIKQEEAKIKNLIYGPE
jgi:hypothetical protein